MNKGSGCYAWRMERKTILQVLPVEYTLFQYNHCTYGGFRVIIENYVL
jgi:hypothetical protein